MEKLKLVTELPATPDQVFTAWMSSEGHAAMTGSSAAVENQIGGEYSAWDGYISGSTLELEPPKRIVQSWRTTEFPEASPDSRLEVLLEATGSGCRITLVHTDIPAGQGEMYAEGWQDYYFTPMQAYFEAGQ